MDPEIRVLDGGVKVARIRLATTERIYNSATQERRDHTEWHTLTLWRGLADIADKYVKKGSQIYVEGKIRSREWEDEATHTKRYATEILVDDLKMLGRREGSSEGGVQPYQQHAPRPAINSPQPSTQEPLTPIDDGDDLPF